MNIYIDASVYVKKYHDESGSEMVHSVFENARDGQDIGCGFSSARKKNIEAVDMEEFNSIDF